MLTDPLGDGDGVDWRYDGSEFASDHKGTGRFERPAQVDFRLVRGSVSHVVGTGRLTERDRHVLLIYAGQLASR